ncbi:MAG: glycoside hydrolase family 130 protein [Candidatus Delongbacteria bacterium]|nr:glycoside hydrolase family 130 protein [Candidatus Delongbacteria bacterium]
MTRYPKNPIITPDQIPPTCPDFRVIGTFNPGVAEYRNKVILLIRVAESPLCLKDESHFYYPLWDPTDGYIRIQSIQADQITDDSDSRKITTRNGFYLTSYSYFRIAESLDGIHFTILDQPRIMPETWYEEFGIEDARISKIDDEYYITYTAVSRYGMSVAMMKTRDFRNFRRLGVVMLPDNKDVVIFPGRVGGGYRALTRPMSEMGSNIWLADSPDLIHWGNHRLLAAKTTQSWESRKIGAGAVPFVSRYGWIEIYHGVSDHDEYALGYLRLDRDHPEKILYRSAKPILAPEMDYETSGFFPNTIFLCGCALRDEMVHLYYSGCDENVALATASIDDFRGDD